MPTNEQLPYGESNIQIKITDIAGNSDTLNSKISVFQSELAPSSDTGVKGDFITSDTTPTFEGQTIADAKIVLSIEGKDYDTTADSAGNWSVTSGVLTEGVKPYSVTVKDPSTDQVLTTLNDQITIDTTPPNLTGGLSSADDPDNDDVISTTQPTFEGTVEAGSAVTVTIDNVDTQDATVNASGNWQLT